MGEELEFFIAGEADNYFADDEYVEIFRFYPTGGGACVISILWRPTKHTEKENDL